MLHDAGAPGANMQAREISVARIEQHTDDSQLLLHWLDVAKLTRTVYLKPLRHVGWGPRAAVMQRVTCVHVCCAVHPHRAVGAARRGGHPRSRRRQYVVNIRSSRRRRCPTWSRSDGIRHTCGQPQQVVRHPRAFRPYRERCERRQRQRRRRERLRGRASTTDPCPCCGTRSTGAPAVGDLSGW